MNADTRLLQLLARSADPTHGAAPETIDTMLDATRAPAMSPEEVRRILAGSGIALAAGAAVTGSSATVAAAAVKSASVLRLLPALGISAAVFTASIALLVFLRGRQAPPEGMQSYPISAPGPAYVSSPVPVFNVPNYDPSLAAPATFHAPPGCRNLAAGCAVTSSAPAPLHGPLSRVCDGLKEGPADETAVELPPGPQWIQLDLGAPRTLYDILVWHRFDAPAVYQDVVVQVSTDPLFRLATTTTVFNNDFDDTLGFGRGQDPNYLETNLGRSISVAAKTARYVRLWSNGRHLDDRNHCVEVEVWGK